MFDAGKTNILLLKSVTVYSIIPLTYVRKELLVLNQPGQTSDCEGKGEKEMPAWQLVCRMAKIFIFSKTRSQVKLGIMAKSQPDCFAWPLVALVLL